MKVASKKTPRGVEWFGLVPLMLVVSIVSAVQAQTRAYMRLGPYTVKSHSGLVTFEVKPLGGHGKRPAMVPAQARWRASV